MLGCVLAGVAFGQDAPAPAPAPAPAADPDMPRMVIVSAKIIEFQATKGVETGLSAYFRRRDRTDWFGIVKPALQGLMTADVTFPNSSTAGITVFLDQIRMTEGDIEAVLQALVDENRAFILSQPKIRVIVRGDAPSTIQTAQKVPYERTVVVGSGTVQSTDTRDTGVTLTIQAPDIKDADQVWSGNDDTYIQLNITAEVSEEGQRLVVALDDQLASGGNFVSGQNEITAPEFITRKIDTKVWVRNGQVLVLGGLYSSSRTESLSTFPWLTQAESRTMELASRVVPGDYLSRVSPVSSVLGNRDVSETRRELVFLLKTEVWRPAFIVPEEHDFMMFEEEAEEEPGAGNVITDVIGEIVDAPQKIGEGIKKKATSEEGIASELGGSE